MRVKIQLRLTTSSSSGLGQVREGDREGMLEVGPSILVPEDTSETLTSTGGTTGTSATSPAFPKHLAASVMGGDKFHAGLDPAYVSFPSPHLIL